MNTLCPTSDPRGRNAKRLAVVIQYPVCSAVWRSIRRFAKKFGGQVDQLITNSGQANNELRRIFPNAAYSVVTKHTVILAKASTTILEQHRAFVERLSSVLRQRGMSSLAESFAKVILGRAGTMCAHFAGTANVLASLVGGRRCVVFGGAPGRFPIDNGLLKYHLPFAVSHEMFAALRDRFPGTLMRRSSGHGATVLRASAMIAAAIYQASRLRTFVRRVRSLDSAKELLVTAGPAHDQLARVLKLLGMVEAQATVRVDAGSLVHALANLILSIVHPVPPRLVRVVREALRSVGVLPTWFVMYLRMNWRSFRELVETARDFAALQLVVNFEETTPLGATIATAFGHAGTPQMTVQHGVIVEYDATLPRISDIRVVWSELYARKYSSLGESPSSIVSLWNLAPQVEEVSCPNLGQPLDLPLIVICNHEPNVSLLVRWTASILSSSKATRVTVRLHPNQSMVNVIRSSFGPAASVQVRVGISDILNTDHKFAAIAICGNTSGALEAAGARLRVVLHPGELEQLTYPFADHPYFVRTENGINEALNVARGRPVDDLAKERVKLLRQYGHPGMCGRGHAVTRTLRSVAEEARTISAGIAEFVY